MESVEIRISVTKINWGYGSSLFLVLVPLSLSLPLSLCGDAVNVNRPTSFLDAAQQEKMREREALASGLMFSRDRLIEMIAVSFQVVQCLNLELGVLKVFGKGLIVHNLSCMVYYKSTVFYYLVKGRQFLTSFCMTLSLCCYSGSVLCC